MSGCRRSLSLLLAVVFALVLLVTAAAESEGQPETSDNGGWSITDVEDLTDQIEETVVSETAEPAPGSDAGQSNEGTVDLTLETMPGQATEEEPRLDETASRSEEAHAAPTVAPEEASTESKSISISAVAIPIIALTLCAGIILSVRIKKKQGK